MNRAIQILTVLGLCGLTGCSSTKTKITTDYYKSADFAAFKSYEWIPFPAKEKADPRLNYDFLGQHIHAAADAELQKKGYTMATSGQPDFRIGWYVAVDQDVGAETVNNFNAVAAGSGWGYGAQGGWSYGGGLGSSYVKVYTVGSLVLDIADGKSNSLIWRGAAHSQIQPKMTPEEKEKRINAAVQEILEKFPPPPEK